MLIDALLVPATLLWLIGLGYFVAAYYNQWSDDLVADYRKCSSVAFNFSLIISVTAIIGRFFCSG